MDKNFKPKAMTKSEWQKNRSPAAKGCNVGKGLDMWQAKYTKKLSACTIKQLTEITDMIKYLEAALGKAKKKLDPKKQKETIDGIGEYLKVTNAYKAKVLRAVLALNNREDLYESIQSLKDIEKDSALWKLYGHYAKSPKGQFYPSYDTYCLLKGKKIAAAVKKYGKGGTGDNEYNLYTKSKRRWNNEILWNHFVLKKEEEKQLVDSAVKSLANQVKKDIEDLQFVNLFKKYDLFVRYVESQYKVMDA
ncbi:MAG: hypothetical protein AB3N23_04660 [Paracoccaceae bacterium]